MEHKTTQPADRDELVALATEILEENAEAFGELAK